jgi:hypothetical protein
LRAVEEWYPALDFYFSLGRNVAKEGVPFRGTERRACVYLDGLVWGYLRNLSDEDKKNPLISPMYVSKGRSARVYALHRYCVGYLGTQC